MKGHLLRLFCIYPFVCFSRASSVMSSDVQIPCGLSSSITLNDGVVMPMFGLGTYMLSSGAGGIAETITSFSLQNGYRLLDTATLYGFVHVLLSWLWYSWRLVVLVNTVGKLTQPAACSHSLTNSFSRQLRRARLGKSTITEQR